MTHSLLHTADPGDEKFHIVVVDSYSVHRERSIQSPKG